MNKLDGRVVLSLCDRSAVMVRPWLKAGYTAVCVDLQHKSGWNQVEERLWLVGSDVRLFLPPRAEYAAAFAFPPCTNLAVSGARWFPEKGLRGLIEGLELVEASRRLLEWCGCPWMLENPVSTISSYWRKPDYKFDPCDYGGYLEPPSDHYTKRTCLWVGGGFRMPEKRPVEPEGVRPGQPNAWYSKVGGSSEETKNHRSQTAVGFARAVFEANAGELVVS